MEGFIAGLRRCGVTAAATGPVVTYDIVPCDGPLAGTPVSTGVAVAELATWPAMPPHWVHLPASVVLAPTNTNPDETLPGWTRHSRQVNGWGDAADLAQAWLAHVRGVLGGAVAGAA